MIPVSAPQLANMRMLDESTMVDRCSIAHKTRVSDGAGGSIITTVMQTNVPCRRSPNLAGNVETAMGGQLASGLQWLFAFPHDIEVGNDDEILYGDERFAVMGTLGPRTLETARRIIAVEIGTN